MALAVCLLGLRAERRLVHLWQAVEAVRAALADDVLPVDGVADHLALVDSAGGRRWLLDRVV
ncbi:hypothetical protein BJF81_11390 [Ornithinimicrobium sp. CNJ-824]|uniref:hypothetical protein n=1 Tax=Ornithinimicrobium sp. CNJ-824 TaxID=1904966 RepID=UPI00095A7993|nr:hypothetical protein [Ornithinimicrobium sp. CNJ-824]OLT23285.1 hypothetical protein BJF81_11390 [Ornithinimicrobium sp. CNJ-824]